MAYAPPTLSPQESAQFTTQRNNARRTYQGGLAANTYQQTLAGLKFKRGKQGLNTQWDRQRAALPGDYIQRGIFDSGIYQRGLKDYATDRSQAFGDLSLGYQGEVGGLKMDARGLSDSYANTLATSQSAEQARRAELASRIRSII